MVISDPAKLQAYLTVWNQLMTLAETEAANTTFTPRTRGE